MGQFIEALTEKTKQFQKVIHYCVKTYQARCFKNQQVLLVENRNQRPSC